MPSAGPAIHHPQQYHPPSTSSPLPSSLITTRPIIPLPKRRILSSTSSSTTTSITNLPLPPPQIFTHTYPPAVVSPTPPYITHEDYESSDSEDDGDDAASTVSSLGREDFNLKNKKKRKIPLSATTTGNVSGGSDGVGGSVMGRVGSRGRLSGWRVSSGTIRGEGVYLRRKTRGSRSSSSQPDPSTTDDNSSVKEGKTGILTPEDGTSSSPAPSGPFSFSCPSPLTLPVTPTAPPIANIRPVHGQQTSHPSAPPTTPLPVPPPPPPARGQENVPPTTQSYPPQQTQQPPPQRLPPPSMKHPNSEKARRVAQLTKLRERYRTGPKPDTVISRPFNPPSPSLKASADDRMKSTSVHFVHMHSSTAKIQST
jgi:hypothetical protein